MLKLLWRDVSIYNLYIKKGKNQKKKYNKEVMHLILVKNEIKNHNQTSKEKQKTKQKKQKTKEK